jgi:flagellar basal-body rod protein FlgB
MLDKLQFQQEALNLRAQRQEVLAANIANADTPGYQARDMDFASELQKAVTQGRDSNESLALTTTSPGHIEAIGSTGFSSQLLYRVPAQPALDGNTVDMDQERTAFADNSMQYQTSLTVLGGQIKNMLAVLQD